MVLVTVPVSVVYTPLVTVPALPPIERLVTGVVDATVKGAVPVATVDVTVVNLPVLAVVPPIAGGDARYVLKPVPLTVDDALNVVNAPVFAAVEPIAGGLDKSSVPPKVRLPELVTVPLSDKPLTVPVPPTLVTVPEPLLLKVVQSVDVRYPLTDAVAAAMLIAGVFPPEETTGAVPVTDVTVPPDGVTQVGALVALLCKICPAVPT
jgi:hypothetical protein